MKKLELKHIAPYLAYELEIEHPTFSIGKREISVLRTITDNSIKVGFNYYVQISDCKPILRPLSQLIKEIEHNGEKFVPMDVLCDDFRETDLLHFNPNDIFNQSYNLIQKLLEWHFDVFGLINDGLAIEKL
jgi:hypothetical protein